MGIQLNIKVPRSTFLFLEFGAIHLASSLNKCDDEFSIILNMQFPVAIQVPFSLNGLTSYCKILLSLEAVRFRYRLFQLPWNLTGTLAHDLIDNWELHQTGAWYSLGIWMFMWSIEEKTMTNLNELMCLLPVIDIHFVRSSVPCYGKAW